ncbi:unnamed protein product [Brassica oleracea]
MSKPSTKILIDGVKPVRHNWQIRVKVLHSWKQTTAFAGNTLEFILADETGVKIAASCKRNQISRLQRELPVGEWKTIDTFAVLGISGQYRPTTHRYKLSFSEETMITKCQVLSDDHYLSLASYDDLRKIDEKKNFFLKDVIGQVVDLDGIQTVQARGKDEQRVQFRLRDARLIIIIIYSLFQDNNNEIVICLIRFAKITFFRGEVQVINAFDASIVAINPKLEEAIELKEKILSNDLPLALIEKREEKKLAQKQKQDWDEIPVRAISEILEATDVESCKIICSIESIDTDGGWFYFGCNRNRHNRRVTKQVPKLAIAGSVMSNPSQKLVFYCDICRGITPDVSPKYELHLFVKDDSDSCTVMMLDSVAQSIIGSAATELWDETYIFTTKVKTDTLILSLLANQSCKSGLTTVRHADSIDPRKRSRTVFNDITNISLEQGNGTQVINKRPKKVNDNMRRSNPSPGETADKEEESEEDDSFAIEGSHYVNEDQYFDCTTPENTDSESEVDSETENYDDHNVKKTEAERKHSVLSRMEALLQMAFTGRNSCAKQTNCKELGYIDDGDPTYTCSHCGAIMWFGERINKINPYVKEFRSARDRFREHPEETFHMRIVSDRFKDGRTYSTPTASEIAALIPGDFNLDMDKRDIDLQKHSGKLMRISEIHAAYLALQYPLIFIYGEVGYRLGINKGVTEATKKQKRRTISMRQFFAFRLHERKNESHTLLLSRRLFQQFLVDAYTTIESNRLRYLKFNQASLRSDSFDSLKESASAGATDMHEQGREYVIPATFTGGPRYMKNNYLDAMAICKHFGFPDLFITFTCNPKWPEITRYLNERKLTSEDRPEIISRMFKIKLDSLMDALTKKNLL